MEKVRWKKFLSRRNIAFAVGTAALFTGHMESTEWLILAGIFIGVLTFEKVKLSAHFGQGG